MQHHPATGNLVFLFGTRPEAIKLCPVFLALERAKIPYITINTGQHRDMVAPVLSFFGCRADHSLALMQAGQTPLSLTKRLMEALPPLLERYRPCTVVVHGDTATAFAGALCAYLSGLRIIHMEAGLRTNDPYAPYPEEFFRTAIDAVSDLHFAPTAAARDTLLREGRPAEHIVVCGNTAIDALRFCLEHPLPLPFSLPTGKRLVLLTAHRRETAPTVLLSLLSAIRRAIESLDDVHLLFPVHPAPTVQQAAKAAFDSCPNATLIAPLPLPQMQILLSRASLLLTDSGGLQEEATYLGIPTLVLREVTERPEGVSAGVLCPVGRDAAQVTERMLHLLSDEAQRQRMAHPSNVYGDGHTAEHIVDTLKKYLPKCADGV